MKKIYYLLVLVFIISCTTPEVNKVVITGTIENPTSEYIVFSAYEGEGSDENNFLMRLFLHAEENRLSEYAMYQLEIDEFLDKLENYYTSRKKLWEEYSKVYVDRP